MSGFPMPNEVAAFKGQVPGYGSYDRVLSEEEAGKLPSMPDRGLDLDGDKLDNLDDWYKEGILGKGGAPTGFMRDLVLRSFFGSWNEKKYFKRSRDYTGPNRTPCQTDYEDRKSVV